VICRRDIETLWKPECRTCLSIYLSTAPGHGDPGAGQSRLEGLLAEAEELLRSRSVPRDERKAIVRHAERLCRNEPFWEDQDEGLAVFLSPLISTFHRLPVAVEEAMHVGPHFHTRPILELYASDLLYYVLTLSFDDIRLFACTRRHIEEIELVDLPGYLIREVMSQERGPAPVKGAGDELLDQERRAEVFFISLDRVVRSQFIDEDAPLILMGVDWLCRFYRRASGHHCIAGHDGKIDVGSLTPGRIHELAKTQLPALLMSARLQAISSYSALQDSGLTSDRIERIASAARDGRVETLLVSRGARIHGRFDESSERVSITDPDHRTSTDLIDFAAAHTIIAGGRLFSCSPAEMPQDGPVLAVFKHP
jgi:hypothetical protein